MAFDIELELQKTFAAAVRENAETHLVAPEYRLQAQEIAEQHEALRRAERDDLKEHFGQRMDDARRKIIAEEGSLTLEHPTPFGTDRFDKTRIDERALGRVERDHEMTLAMIDTSEAEALRELAEPSFERAAQEQSQQLDQTTAPALTQNFQRSAG
ncbi:MAG: hypothetical protein AAF360_01560 [Pseudomonadota bacterium]